MGIWNTKQKLPYYEAPVSKHHKMWSYRGSRGKAQCGPCQASGQLQSPTASLPKSFDRRTGGSQSQPGFCGEGKQIRAPTGNRNAVIWPTANHLTDWAIPVIKSVTCWVKKKKSSSNPLHPRCRSLQPLYGKCPKVRNYCSTLYNSEMRIWKSHKISVL